MNNLGWIRRERQCLVPTDPSQKLIPHFNKHMDTLDFGKKKRRVPVLRFGEFEGEWTENLLSDIATFQKGKGISKADIVENGNIECIRYGELYTTYSEIIEDIVSRTNIDTKNLILSEFNDVIIPASGETQLDIATASCVLKKGIALSGDLNIIRSTVNGIFLSYYLNNKRKLDIARLSQGTSVVHLYSRQLKTLLLNTPSLPEQKKIATFLSTIDKKIQQLSRKKELLEQYKKGLMQQLFPSKAGQVPELRFQDEEGKDHPDWEEKLYGDIYSFYSTNSLSRDKLNYEDGDVKNIHYGDIHTKFSTLFDINDEYVPFVNKGVDISKVKKESYCQEGDLVIADASEDYADIGKAIELVNLNNEKLIAGLHTFLARPNKTKIHIGFSGYLVQAWYIRKQIMTIAQGTKVLGLSMGRMSKLKINVPCLQEQQKIAKTLSQLDKKIATLSNKITQTQNFKKGLLQQMFV